MKPFCTFGCETFKRENWILPCLTLCWLILQMHTLKRISLAAFTLSCFKMPDLSIDILLSQARALGDQLVLGLIPDSEILRCKGPPVMNESERKTMVESVKWVGEVITGVYTKPISRRALTVERYYAQHPMLLACINLCNCVTQLWLTGLMIQVCRTTWPQNFCKCFSQSTTLTMSYMEMIPAICQMGLMHTHMLRSRADSAW